MYNINEKRETDSQSPQKDYTGEAHDFKVNPFSSGQGQFPQFGESAGLQDIQTRIAEAKSNGWGLQLAGFIGRNKKRIFVLAAVVVLFAASSYLSNKADQNPSGEEKSAGIAGVSQNTPDILEIGNDKDQEEDTQVAGPKPLDLKLDQDGKVIINDSDEEASDAGKLFAQTDTNSSLENIAVSAEAITASAQKGEGITHLARHALAEYLKDAGTTLTAEQKIYAEDYVQNKTGSEILEIGEKLSFSTDLLKEAVQKAETLQGWQIENLKQYTTIVSLL